MKRRSVVSVTITKSLHTVDRSYNFLPNSSFSLLLYPTATTIIKPVSLSIQQTQQTAVLWLWKNRASVSSAVFGNHLAHENQSKLPVGSTKSYGETGHLSPNSLSTLIFTDSIAKGILYFAISLYDNDKHWYFGKNSCYDSKFLPELRLVLCR